MIKYPRESKQYSEGTIYQQFTCYVQRLTDDKQMLEYY